MKNYWTVIAIAGLLSLAAGGQSGTNSSPRGNAQRIVLSPGDFDRDRHIKVELAKTLDSRKAKVGDPIEAKVVDYGASYNNILIPKGSKLVGHIALVQAYTKESPESRLGLAFEKFVLKGGREVAFLGTIERYFPLQPEPSGRENTISTISSNDDPQGRAAGPVIDKATGKVYQQHPADQNSDPSSKIPNLHGRGSDKNFNFANYAMLNSIFNSSISDIRLERGTTLIVSGQQVADSLR